MKNILIKIVILFLCAIPLFAVAQEENHTVIFIDKSGSVQAQNPAQDRYIFGIVKGACSAKKSYD